MRLLRHDRFFFDILKKHIALTGRTGSGCLLGKRILWNSHEFAGLVLCDFNRQVNMSRGESGGGGCVLKSSNEPKPLGAPCGGNTHAKNSPRTSERTLSIRLRHQIITTIGCTGSTTCSGKGVRYWAGGLRQRRVPFPDIQTALRKTRGIILFRRNENESLAARSTRT